MNLLMGEHSLTKVASVFADEAHARDAARDVAAQVVLNDDQVSVLSPADGDNANRARFGRKVQPESHGIALTFWKSHLLLGSLGGLLGGLLWWTLQTYPSIASSPVAALVALVGFGITFGLLLAGVITLRPDQAALYAQVQDRLRHHMWAVVFHPDSARRAKAIEAALLARHATVMSSM